MSKCRKNIDTVRERERERERELYLTKIRFISKEKIKDRLIKQNYK